MNIGTTGIIIDQKMQLLVIKRDDTRTWAPPGGSSDAGEMPTESVTREVEEETGFKVMPVRLVGLSFIPEFGEGVLQFTFRCLLRGGEAHLAVTELDLARSKGDGSLAWLAAKGGVYQAQARVKWMREVLSHLRSEG